MDDKRTRALLNIVSIPSYHSNQRVVELSRATVLLLSLIDFQLETVKTANGIEAFRGKVTFTKKVARDPEGTP